MNSQGTDPQESMVFGANPPNPFKPSAQYVAALDRITVTAKAGRLTEIWADCNLHLQVETKHLVHRKVVAFCLDGCRTLARGIKPMQDGRFSILDLLDELGRACPSTPLAQLSEARAVVRKLEDQTIELPGTYA
jgi:hypothetical protein